MSEPDVRRIASTLALSAGVAACGPPALPALAVSTLDPEPEPEPEPPPPRVVTSGECVGSPSVTARRTGSAAVCCYTSPAYFQRHVRTRWSSFQACYDAALARRPGTIGRVVARFTIEETGLVTQACDAGSDVEDPELVRCVLAGFTTVEFEAYDASFCPPVTLMYPISFAPKG